jgi:hypothetical protein
MRSAHSSKYFLTICFTSVTAGTRDAQLECGVKLYPNADEAALKLAESHDLRFEDGKMTGVLDGKRVGLGKILQHIAVTHDYLVSDRRTLRGKSAGDSETAEKPMRARSELTQAEKITLLHSPGGYDIWEKMAAFPTKNVPVDQLSRAEFSRLPTATKMGIVAEKGANFETWLAHLPRESKQR